MGHTANVQINAGVLKCRQQHLHNEGLIDGDCPAQQVPFSARAIIRIDLPENFIPGGQIIENRIVLVTRRSIGKYRFEQRCKLALCRRDVRICCSIIFEAVSVSGQATLQGKANREPATGCDILDHYRFQQLNHDLDAGHIAVRIS